jgi:hypothetical protein
MTELMIKNGLVIDDVESVLIGIRKLSNKGGITDIGVVKKFINNEKNTIFYVDNHLNSFMQQDSGNIYVWLDSGFTDNYGNPIFISLLKDCTGYTGHMVGNVYFLAENIGNFFRLNHNMIEKKIMNFKKKYVAKSGERIRPHIENESDYLIRSCSAETGPSLFAEKIETLKIDFGDDDELLEAPVDEADIGDEGGLTPIEEEITIGLLLEKMENMQSDMEELLAIMEHQNSESMAKIEELQRKNAEYRRAIIQMRTFSEQWGDEDKSENDVSNGHNLLGKHGKILIVGGEELGVNVIRGIAKTYGFEKRDFEFVAYDKVKDYTDRVRKGGRYCAVIFGACPHKVSGIGGYSSAVEMFKQTEGMPFIVEARSKSGKLKLTKESFREALNSVCGNLRLAYAS